LKIQEIKDKLKNSLTIEEVENFVNDLGGEAKMQGDMLVCKTICHHSPDEEGSHKLYYYDNTKLFVCYSSCGTFDIFDLLIKSREQLGREIELYQAIVFVNSYFGNRFNLFNDTQEEKEELEDWALIRKFQEAKEKKELTFIPLKKYEDPTKHLPRPRIPEWEAEGISKQEMDKRNICYDPAEDAIIIPHYDVRGNLVGVRKRTLVKEDEIYGKYRPATFNGQMYNHPLGINLYNLNFAKENIKKAKKCIVFESEKSTLQYSSQAGAANDISVAVCGSSLTVQQVRLLLELGVEEIIIAFDKQYKELNDPEHLKWVKKLRGFHKKYCNEVNISFVFDLGDLLGYKDSPMDRGLDVFMKLYKERIMI
jgi:hypothetical protein